MKTKYLSILPVILSCFVNNTSVIAMEKDDERRAPRPSTSQSSAQNAPGTVDLLLEQQGRPVHEYLGAVVCAAVEYNPAIRTHLNEIILEMADSIHLYTQVSDRHAKASENLSVLLREPTRSGPSNSTGVWLKSLKALENLSVLLREATRSGPSNPSDVWFESLKALENLSVLLREATRSGPSNPSDVWFESLHAIGRYYIQQGQESTIMELVDREIFQQEDAWSTPKKLQYLGSNYAEALLRGPWIPDDQRASTKQRALEIMQELQKHLPEDDSLQMLFIEFFFIDEDPSAIEAFKAYCNLRKKEILKEAPCFGTKIKFTDDDPIRLALQIKPDLTRRILEELRIPEDFTALPRKHRSTGPAETSSVITPAETSSVVESLVTE